MNSEEQTYQLIENYLNGELTGEELKDFEYRFGADPSFKQKVELSKVANELVIERKLLHVKNILHETHQNSTSGFSGYKTLLISGGILILGTALYFSIRENISDKESELVQNNTISIPSDLVPSKQKEEQQDNSLKPTSNAHENKSLEVSAKKDSTSQSNSITSTSNSEVILTQEEKIDKKPSVDIAVPSPALDPCSDIKMTADISEKASCLGEETGSIQVSEIKGGTNPYHYQIKDAEGNKLVSNYQLGAGVYTVNLIDKNGCQTSLENIRIKEKPCPKDYSFNPFLGENWNIPVSENSGVLTIYERSGRIYYQKELNSGQEEVWNGYSAQGELQTGYFIFDIHYKNGTVIKGSVTIVK